MRNSDTIKEFGRAGWTIHIEAWPDDEYRPGEWDEAWPRLTYVDARDYYAGEPGDLGPFPGISQGEYYCVKAADVERLLSAWQTAPEDRAEMVERIADDAAAIANGSLYWVTVCARASRAGHELGSASLGGIDQDTRDAAYACDLAGMAEEYDLVGEAIAEAEQEALKICGAVV